MGSIRAQGRRLQIEGTGAHLTLFNLRSAPKHGATMSAESKQELLAGFNPRGREGRDVSTVEVCPRRGDSIRALRESASSSPDSGSHCDAQGTCGRKDGSVRPRRYLGRSRTRWRVWWCSTPRVTHNISSRGQCFHGSSLCWEQKESRRLFAYKWPHSSQVIRDRSVSRRSVQHERLCVHLVAPFRKVVWR